MMLVAGMKREFLLPEHAAQRTLPAPLQSFFDPAAVQIRDRIGQPFQSLVLALSRRCRICDGVDGPQLQSIYHVGIAMGYAIWPMIWP